MDINHPRRVQQTAASCLSAASYNPRRLVLIHSGAAMAFTLLLTIINFIVTRQIEGTGGLSGLGMRSILSTIQTVLQYANMILMPFWQIGFAAAVLAYARKQPVGLNTLFKGFRRFSSVLGLLVTEFFIVIAVGFACVYLCTSIFMFTPAAQPIIEILTPVMEESSMLSTGTVTLDDATMNAMMEAMLPLLLLSLAVYILVMIPLLFRFRLAELVLMDEPRCGGIRALITSTKLMRRNCIRLFKLDLRFWLFYVLQTLCLLVGYADIILPMFGVALPINADVAFFVFYILQLFAQLALHLWAKPMLQTSYAVFYDNLLVKPVQETQTPAPKKLPWDYT